jgi:hypothetical protein
LDLRLLLLREVAAREQRVNRAELLHDRAAALRSGVREGRALSDGVNSHPFKTNYNYGNRLRHYK